MGILSHKTVLILGANSDVAKQAIRLYAEQNCNVIAASRSTQQLYDFVDQHPQVKSKVEILYFDAVAFDTHQAFYNALPLKPHIVIYAAGFLRNNEEALLDFEGSYQMMKVHYVGAVHTQYYSYGCEQ
jgi:short-subunit dehydrogenase